MASYVSYGTVKPAGYELRLQHELQMRQAWMDAHQDDVRRPFKPCVEKEDSDDRVQTLGA